MSKGKSDKITYKPYVQHQIYLIPPSADELIPQNHLVRLVNEVIDEMGIERLIRKHQKGGGTSRYHPVMMTKVFVYGYMTKVCSSRMLARALRENVMFMWLSGNSKPDFRTLNDFRGKQLQGVIEELFVTAVKMLAAKGYIKLERYFVDGTKIESASGRYTFVWKKSVEKHNTRLDEKLRTYMKLASQVWEEENAEYGERDIEELGEKRAYTSADVKELVRILKERLEHLEEAGSKKKVKKAIKTIEQEYLPRKKKYERTKKISGPRNSYSKTDVDATFMRMKEDHMGNGQLKPAYNVQTGTENGFVTGYDIFANPADMKTLKPHLRKQAQRLGVKPNVVITDAGYGSEENYVYLENRGTVAVVKYGMWRKERSRKYQEDIFTPEHWEYNKKEKYYVCPNGKRLRYRATQESKARGGLIQRVERYECESCTECFMKEACTSGKGNRSISRNERWLRLKGKAQKVLEEEQYKALRKQRSVEIETVFGQIKGNQGYRRFLLRGTGKVSTEWGLLCLGYNIKQLFRLSQLKTA